MSNRDNEIADRLMALLDVATEAVRKGDGDVALMAVKEAAESANGFSRRPDVICLPDLSKTRNAT